MHNKSNSPVLKVVSVSVLTAIVIGGCAVGPNFKKPEPNMPGRYVGAAGTQAASDEMLARWWTVFNDPNLNSLIERAEMSNLDLKVAEQRVRQARAQRGVVAAGLYPNLNASADYTRTRTPKSVTGPANTRNLFTTGLDSSWEIDIFGGTRRAVEAAEAGIQIAVEDRRDTLVTLTSEVALNYVELRGFQQQIVIAHENLAAQQHTADLTRERFAGGTGFASRLDVANADAQVATTLATIPVLETSARQTIYNISVLLGQEPDALLKELSAPSQIPASVPELPAGLPSDLLRRRPDIRSAEAQIHQATANVGVAVADLFPKFNLVGNLSFSGTNTNMFNWSNRFWSIGPSVNWQLFSAGAVQSNIKVQKAIEQQFVLGYQKTVLTALQDVEDALIAYVNEQQHHKALADAVASNKQAVQLSTLLYTEGITDFLSVLDAQRSLYATQQAYTQSTANLSTDLIALYKALGGGWEMTDQAKGTK
jgi:multidrug efflux system outer membrane protein